MKSRMFWGIVLILAGVLWLVKPHIELGGGAFLAGVGFLFVLLWALTSRYGLLVPGGILLGLGSGLWAGRLMPGPSGRGRVVVWLGGGGLRV
jgi:hypothetical protein